jgi:hypothetical protein
MRLARPDTAADEETWERGRRRVGRCLDFVDCAAAAAATAGGGGTATATTTTVRTVRTATAMVAPLGGRRIRLLADSGVMREREREREAAAADRWENGGSCPRKCC